MKNLSNFKIIIKTREYLIQAIYQMLFSNDDIQKIITQFKEEHKDKKVNFNEFATTSIYFVFFGKNSCKAGSNNLTVTGKPFIILNISKKSFF